MNLFDAFVAARTEHPRHKEIIVGDGRLEVYSYTPDSKDCTYCKLQDAVEEYLTGPQLPASLGAQYIRKD